MDEQVPRTGQKADPICPHCHRDSGIVVGNFIAAQKRTLTYRCPICRTEWNVTDDYKYA